MPVYEYRCRSCGHQFDVQQSFTDDALTVCPECEGELRKVFAPVGISFKGSGFYKTDSRSSGSSSSKNGSSSGSSGDGSTSTSASGGSSGDSSSGSSSSSSNGSSSSSTSSSTSGSSSSKD